jgi:hypothetical protein
MQTAVIITTQHTASNSSTTTGILRRNVNPKEEIQNGESEIRVLGETFGTKRDELARAGEYCVKRRFNLCHRSFTFKF